MIKCSHLTPKSIYSYIDDLVIPNCLIDASIGCACFCHIFQLPFYCVSMLVAYFTHSRTSTCCFDCLALFFICQVDVQECLRTSSSYLCFTRLKLYSCYITKSIKSDSNHSV